MDVSALAIPTQYTLKPVRQILLNCWSFDTLTSHRSSDLAQDFLELNGRHRILASLPLNLFYFRRKLSCFALVG